MSDLDSLDEVLVSNKRKGREDLFRQNTFDGFIQAGRLFLMAARSAEAMEKYSARVDACYQKVMALDDLDVGLGLIGGDVLSQLGDILGRDPSLREMAYLEVCRNSVDFLNPLSAISYNLYLGEAPDKDLPTKFDKRLAKDADAILALVENPKKGIAAAEKMWDRRKDANMHHWYGTGPAHDYLLDPLILCILKYHKADFESDSIHMKGYRFLAANGFGMSCNVRHD